MDPDSRNSKSSIFDTFLPSYFRKRGKELPIAIGKDEMFYKMDNANKRCAFIFNHYDYDPKLKARESFKERKGTEFDLQELSETLEYLGFKTAKYKDLKAKEVESTLKEISRQDFHECDCLVICVLSHGKENMIYAYDEAYPMDLLIETFTPNKCRSLAGKPKVFVLQSCQGERKDDGCKVRFETDGADDDVEEGSKMYKLPLYADFLIACSTMKGFVSFRGGDGSYYIKVLCEELRRHCGEKDILTILTYVNRRIAVNFESRSKTRLDLNKKKQMPCFTSTLTRSLIFPLK